MKWVAMSAVLLLMTLASMPASAQQRVPAASLAKTAQAGASVVVLHALNDGKGIDPKIGKMPQLKQPPFSSYNSYRLLKRSKLSLTTAKAEALTLPNRGKLAIKLTKVQPGKRGGRYLINTRIDRPDGKKFFSGDFKARPGKLFFVAGERYKKGILVLGISIHRK